MTEQKEDEEDQESGGRSGQGAAQTSQSVESRLRHQAQGEGPDRDVIGNLAPPDVFGGGQNPDQDGNG
jgi:hypothetical protein